MQWRRLRKHISHAQPIGKARKDALPSMQFHLHLYIYIYAQATQGPRSQQSIDTNRFQLTNNLAQPPPTNRTGKPSQSHTSKQSAQYATYNICMIYNKELGGTHLFAGRHLYQAIIPRYYRPLSRCIGIDSLGNYLPNLLPKA